MRHLVQAIIGAKVNESAYFSSSLTSSLLSSLLLWFENKKVHSFEFLMFTT